MLHIGLVIDGLGVHGGVRRHVELGNALTSAGHWVTMYSADGVPCPWLPQLAEPATFADLENAKLDALIYSAGLEAAYHAAMSARARVKIHYFLSVPNFDVLDNPQDDYTRRVASMLLSKDWLVACCSTAMTEDMRRYREDAIVLLGGVNRSIFHRRKVKAAGDNKIVLSSGDFREREGSGDAKAAVEIAKRSFPNVVWDGYFKRGYSQKQMAECYSAASIFLDAQRYAGWNNAVAEAMACGTPVICTDIGGSRDLAINDKTALVVPPRDVNAMARAVERLLSDDALRVRLVKGALERVAMFDYARMAQRVEKIINGSISGID